MAVVMAAGCHMIFPEISYLPVVRNPFPEFSRVAVAPFFNQSDEPTVDGREFALAYFGELQAIQGFEVVPLGVVEEAILQHEIDLSKPSEIRRLARLLDVDVVVVGSVTDFSPYYPPRCGLRVEWYAACPGYREIPAGYGLPWGTPQEEFIPDSLVYEARMARARAELASMSPAAGSCYETEDGLMIPESSLPSLMPPGRLPEGGTIEQLPSPDDIRDSTTSSRPTRSRKHGARRSKAASRVQPALAVSDSTTGATVARSVLSPAEDDSLGADFSPYYPSDIPCAAGDGPIMAHTRIYHGSDGDFTEALASYVYFREDARFGGWQNYLQRSDDFIRFCCHKHIAEMLTARGGGQETRVVWRWSECR